MFKFLTGDINWRREGGMFVSNRLNNGQFDYWLVLNFINLETAIGEANPRYQVEIMAVSPSQAKTLPAALQDYDNTDMDTNDPLVQVEALAIYGTGAMLWWDSGNNYKKLMQAALKEAKLIEPFFGFYMDKQQNALGATGWDFIKGDVWPST